MAKVAIKSKNITSFGGIYIIFCGFSYFPIGLGGEFYDYERTKTPRKSPYQWINPQYVTSIYKL